MSRTISRPIYLQQEDQQKAATKSAEDSLLFAVTNLDASQWSEGGNRLFKTYPKHYD